MSTHKQETDKKDKGLSSEQIRLIGRPLFIVSLLAQAKHSPDKFPLQEGLCVYNDFFKVKALSKEEIIKWFNVNALGELQKMTAEEFDELIKVFRGTGLLGYVHYKDKPKEILYYCLSV